jgi:heme oxygenase
MPSIDSPAPVTTTLLGCLREQTRPDHERAERVVDLGRLTSQRSAYTAWLTLQHQWLGSLLPAAVHVNPAGEADESGPVGWMLRQVIAQRRDWLDEDLTGRARPTMAVAASRVDFKPDRWTEGEAAAVGTLYVVLGSAMGAAVIDRRLGQAGHDDWPRHFLAESASPPSRKQWRALLRMTERPSLEPWSASVVAAARRAFASFGGPPPDLPRGGQAGPPAGVVA